MCPIEQGPKSEYILLDRIAHPGLTPTVQLLPTELVLRPSCGCPSGTVTRQPVKTLKPG
jgi:hypothetical protein